jgi:BASS family bile acid:Na+ symporter
MLSFSLSRFLKNSNLVFLAAFFFGLIFGGYASLLKEFLLPALVLIMSLATTRISLFHLTGVRPYLRDILVAFMINYLFLSGIILLANQIIVRDHDLYVGFVVMAAIPSAVAVLPFTYVLEGEMMVSFFGSIGLYLFALVMAPVISLTLLDVARIDLPRLIYALALMILLPFLISRILSKWKILHRLREETGILVNLAFFLIIYVVIGMNRSVFLSHFDILIAVSFIAFLRTFFSGHLVDFLSRLAGTGRGRRMSYVLFGSFKNLGLSAAIAVVLFNERAAIPSAVAIPFEILFFVWFNYFQKRWR